MISIAFQGSLEEIQKEMRQFLMTPEVPRVMVEPSTPKEQKPTKTLERLVDQQPSKLVVSKAETLCVTPSSDLLAEIKAIIPKLVKAKGRPAVVELLAEFGATSGGEIKDADRVTFLEKAHSLLPE